MPGTKVAMGSSACTHVAPPDVPPRREVLRLNRTCEPLLFLPARKKWPAPHTASEEEAEPTRHPAPVHRRS